MAGPQHLRGSLGGFIYNMMEGTFSPSFGLCKMCDVIFFQIEFILEGRWAGMAHPQHLSGSIEGFINNVKKEAF